MFSESGLTAAGGSVVSYKEKINYLKRYIWLDRRINKKLEQLTEWRSRLGKLEPHFSNVPGSGGSIYKSLDLTLIDKIVDIEAEINREIDELIILKGEIKTAIDNLEDEKEKTLMEYRYLSGMTFEWIASEMNYSWRWIHVLHQQALKHLEIKEFI